MSFTSVVSVASRIRILPRRHRLAHLRALIGGAASGSLRRRQLAALLRDELAQRRLAGSRAV